jgi:hypothetical protein
LILQLLVWVLLAIAAFSLHWAIGITIIGWILFAPMTLLMKIEQTALKSNRILWQVLRG